MNDDDEFLQLMDEYVENLAGLARVMQQVDRELRSDAHLSVPPVPEDAQRQHPIFTGGALAGSD